MKKQLLLYFIVIAFDFTACKKSSPVRNVPATVSTFAGSGAQGAANGNGTASSFYHPKGMALDASGNVFVADDDNNMIRKITSAGVVTTFAGSGADGSTNGPANTATFNFPTGVAIDAGGNIYVADDGNNMIRKITAGGIVSTLAGSGLPGSVNGAGAVASFNHPIGIAVDASGFVYVADYQNSLIRKITPDGIVSTLAGDGTLGSVNGPGANASFNFPAGVAADPNGNVYVADANGCTIRKITPVGVVSTLAGTGDPGKADGTGASASFFSPQGITVDHAGILYIADGGNDLVRKITPGGVVTTLAGNGVPGNSNGAGTAASFQGPDGIVVDGAGNNLYVGDTFNNLIRKIVLH